MLYKAVRLNLQLLPRGGPPLQLAVLVRGPQISTSSTQWSPPERHQRVVRCPGRVPRHACTPPSPEADISALHSHAVQVHEHQAFHGSAEEVVKRKGTEKVP